jgi:hypothetical protein
LSWLDFCLIQSATKDISTILGPTVIIFNDYILQKWRTGHRSPKYRLQPSLPSSRAREVSMTPFPLNQNAAMDFHQ